MPVPSQPFATTALFRPFSRGVRKHGENGCRHPVPYQDDRRFIILNQEDDLLHGVNCMRSPAEGGRQPYIALCYEHSLHVSGAPANTPRKHRVVLARFRECPSESKHYLLPVCAQGVFGSDS